MKKSCPLPAPVGNSIRKKLYARIKSIFNIPVTYGEYYYLMFGATTLEQISEIQKRGEMMREECEAARIRSAEQMKELGREIDALIEEVIAAKLKELAPVDNI